MAHLKECFVSTRKQESACRNQDGMGGSGGKMEGYFARLRREVFQDNPAVSKSPMRESVLRLGRALYDEQLGDEEVLSQDRSSLDKEEYAREDDSIG